MGKTILYLDPWSGISGDMLLAALVDAGREDGRLESELRGAIAGLGVSGVTVEVLRDVEWGMDCTRLRVDDGGAAPLRHLADMERIIIAASLSDKVKTRCIEAVRRLAAVEAQVHGCAVDDIHFHEVGAVDTLVDVVGAFTLVEALGIDEVAVGTIPVGGGTVEIAHGRMGVPAPATARLLQGYEIAGGPEERELTTPTGALLLSQLEARQGALPRMRVEKIGYGAGSMKLEHGPNVLRVVIGTVQEAAEAEVTGSEEVVELQTNLDDLSPETVGHAVRLLRETGVLDAWTVPAYMKKDRPGVVLHVLVCPGGEAGAVASVFEQTGTLGIRRQVMSRHVAERGAVTVTVEGAQVGVKWGRWQGRLVSVAPEYEDAVAASASTGLPLKDVMHLAAQAARHDHALSGERDDA
ncbi:MAG: nickel pincer cofactor biosynthesis protein LarC [Thermoleophilia bacterium]|nr:nickel pincer cofactor biosynthesis protein LarC [Thermoleophilia bacterium]